MTDAIFLHFTLSFSLLIIKCEAGLLLCYLILCIVYRYRIPLFGRPAISVARARNVDQLSRPSLLSPKRCRPACFIGFEVATGRENISSTDIENMWTGRDFAGVKLIERSHAYAQRAIDDEDEYYAFIEDAMQHPWYTQIMIVILIALVVTSIGYAIYMLTRSRIKKRAHILLENKATQEKQDANQHDSKESSSIHKHTCANRNHEAIGVVA